MDNTVQHTALLKKIKQTHLSQPTTLTLNMTQRGQEQTVPLSAGAGDNTYTPPTRSQPQCIHLQSIIIINILLIYNNPQNTFTQQISV